MSEVKIVTVEADRAGQRLDNFLLGQLKGVPKSWVYRVIRKGQVRVNGKRCKPLQALQAGDQVRIPPVRTSDPKEPTPVSQNLQDKLRDSVLYEDDSLLVINKPSGLAVHGGSGVSLGLIEALRTTRTDLHFIELVHRLDRDTSGCVMLAKKRSALKAIQQAIQAKKVVKKYLCLVNGFWPDSVTEIKVPLLKVALKSGERMVRVSDEGKKSHTTYKVIEHFPGYTLLEASPITGRTHQIRVHCQYQRCPIAGDDKYSPDDLNQAAREMGLNRLFLHASELRLAHPITGEQLVIKASLDGQLSSVVQKLKSES